MQRFCSDDTTPYSVRRRRARVSPSSARIVGANFASSESVGSAMRLIALAQPRRSPAAFRPVTQRSARAHAPQRGSRLRQTALACASNSA